MTEFREIEAKFFLRDEDYLSAVGKLLRHLKPSNVITDTQEGSGLDVFYDTGEASFVRIREYDDSIIAGELTMKADDKGSIRDRLETNVKLYTKNDMANAKVMCETLYGDAITKVWKKYFITWLDEGNNISIYEAFKPGIPLILEIETNSMEELSFYSTICKSIFPDAVVSNDSLFELSKESDHG